MAEVVSLDQAREEREAAQPHMGGEAVCEALTAYFHHGLFRFRCMSCGVDHANAIFGDPA